MPGLTGFDVIRKLPSSGRIPMVVIVTAFDQHAIQAFEAGAIDYLLKPIGQDRLAQAVDAGRSVWSAIPGARASQKLRPGIELCRNSRPRRPKDRPAACVAQQRRGISAAQR